MAEENQNVTIACNATGQPSPNITWSKSVGRLPESRSHVQGGTMKIFGVARKDGGIYICKAENILGSTTDTVLLIVYSPLRFKVRPPQEVTPNYGSTLRLPCVAESELSTTITWLKNGVSVLPANTYVLHRGTLGDKWRANIMMMKKERTTNGGQPVNGVLDSHTPHSDGIARRNPIYNADNHVDGTFSYN